MNSVREEVMPVIVSVQCPLLLRDIISSTNDPTHALGEPPRSPITTASLGGFVVPVNSTVLGPPGSLLETVMVDDFVPKLVGSKRIGTSREVPASMVSGYDKTLGTRKSPREEVMLVMVSRLKHWGRGNRQE